LEEILRTHLANYGITVELSKGLIAIDQTGDVINATIAVHKSGQQTEERDIVVTKYLIGTDGAKGAYSLLACTALLSHPFLSIVARSD